MPIYDQVKNQNSQTNGPFLAKLRQLCLSTLSPKVKPCKLIDKGAATLSIIFQALMDSIRVSFSAGEYSQTKHIHTHSIALDSI